MKQIFTPFLIGICLIASVPLQAQVVLNEIYADPGSGNQEFFEFYNINTSNAPSSVDAYTVISYFEEGSKKGFYVLDLPNLFVASKGYFVGASSIPFNYQGNLNSTAADFSWNDPALTLNYGYLRKWVDNGNNASDGNRNYDLETLPLNFNDFFKKRSGGGASYNALLYKNGKFINSFFGGTGGATNMPSFITSMPVFKLETVTASNSSISTINFNSIKNKSIEYVTQDIGTDNGFMKTKDGFCGTWTKSSSTSFHTPKITNGSQGGDDNSTLTLDVHLYNGATIADPSFVVYNITAGPASAFPVELQVYLDNGSIAGQLDSGDEFVEIQEENTVNSGPFTTYLPLHKNVLIVAKTDAGCIDQIAFAANPLAEIITLPIKLLSLQGSVVDNDVLIQWTVSENEAGTYFQVEKSIDGKNFVPAGIVFNTIKAGTESYQYKEQRSEYIYYRLKELNKDKSIAYSKIVLLKSNPSSVTGMSLQLLQNPVLKTINFNFQSPATGVSTISIYTINGNRLFTRTAAMHKGLNSVSFNPANNFVAGMYILEVRINNQRTTTKFIKQ